MEPLQGTASGQTSIARVRYTHDAMIDLILLEPAISQNQIAVTFGYTVGWVSRVIGSDAFQARLADRKVEVVNPEIKLNLEQRIQGLALQSLAIVQQKLDAAPSLDGALKALELTTKALGFGARAANVQTNNTFVVALPVKMQSESDWATVAQGQARALTAPRAPVVLEAEVVAVRAAA